MELQALYPAKPILKVFAELFSKSDRFPFTRVLQSANAFFQYMQAGGRECLQMGMEKGDGTWYNEKWNFPKIIAEQRGILS